MRFAIELPLDVGRVQATGCLGRLYRLEVRFIPKSN